MIRTLLSLLKKQPEVEEAVSKYHIAKSGSELLMPEDRQVVIRKIKRLFSITDGVWIDHYLYAIEQFAELVQEVPASEAHHHSEFGGLIDHTLETLHAGARISQGHILPPNSEPEKISSSSDRWRFGTFMAILAHDIGKVVTDLEIVYSQKGEDFQYWHPWYGSIPNGAEYAFRYKPRGTNARIAKSLHEKAAMSLLPNLLTKKAAQWIFEDPELLSQLFCTITHSTFGGNALSEIVRAADMSSVANNLGADTGISTDHSSVIPLHEKLILSLRKLLNDGELKRNKPGAAVWITKNETWAVSKATMEAVRLQLVNEGHKGIPKNIVRLFEVLREHDLLIPNQEGESVWIAEVNDFAKNWQQKLTFLRFKNEILWPTSNPEMFDGELIPVDKSGERINEEGRVVIPVIKETIEIASVTENVQKEVVVKKSKIESESSKEAGKPVDNSPATKQSRLPIKQNANDGIDSIQAKNLWKQPKKVREETLKKNHFICWMLLNIATKKLRVNEPGAKVHVLESHIAIVSPSIFESYFSGNPTKKSIYAKKAGDNQVYTVLQKEIVALGINQIGTDGKNIVSMTVNGEKRKSKLNVFLLNRSCFPSLKSFSTNKVMKIFL